MDELRKIPFVLALIAIVLAWLVEVGASFFLHHPPPNASQIRNIVEHQHTDPEPSVDALRKAREGEQEPPGQAVPCLAWLDALLLLTVGLMGTALVIPARILGRLQAPTRLILSFLIIVGSIITLIKSFTLLMLMVSLLLATPFGTIAYLVMWGFFDRAGAAVALSVVMALKLIFAVCLLLAQPAFLKGKMLVVLTLTSLLANVVISFLHGFVPGILASITDALAAIIVAILAIVWGLIIFIGVIIPTIKSFRVEHESS